MYKYFNTLTNKKGDAMLGSVKVIDRTTDLVVPIYSDESGTPVPGNLALSDGFGLAEFFVQDGVYHLDVFSDPEGNDFFRRITSVQMTSLVTNQRSPRSFGASGTGLTDDRAAFVSCDDAGHWRLDEGTYRIGSDVTFIRDVSLEQGSLIIVPNGVTVTFEGDVVMGRYQVFRCEGTGSVVLNPNKVPVGYPEWWGLKVNDSSGTVPADNLSALYRCYTMCPVTMLPAGWTYIDNVFQIEIDGREIVGVGSSSQFFLKGNPLDGIDNDKIRASTSALVLTGANAATQDVVIVGRGMDYAMPGAPPIGWTAKPRIRGFDVRRDIPIAPASPSNETYGPSGVRFAFCSDFQAEDIFSFNSGNGFYYGASVYGRTDWCHALRNNNGTNSNDFWIGFFIDGGFMLGSTYAGGNASIQFTHCKSACFISPTGGGQATSYLLNRGIADTFMNDMESYGSPNLGLWIYGANENSDPNIRQRSNGDIKLTRMIIDGAGQNSLRIEKMTAHTTMTFSDCYFASAGSLDQTCVFITDCEGSILFDGGHLLGWVNALNGGTGYGVYIHDSSGVELNGLQITGAIRPVVVDYSRDCLIAARINNPKQLVAGNNNPNAAILLKDQSHHITVDSQIYAAETHGGERPGGYKAFQCGVACESTTNNNTIRGGGINSTWMSSGYAVKSGWNDGTKTGTNVTAAGSFGTSDVLTERAA